MTKIFFFGDSICFGQGISIHKGWVTMVAVYLNGLSKKSCIINASINGNTTRQALERMPYDIQSHQVDILVIQFGMNDCNYWATDRGVPRVSPDAFEANLHEIIQRARMFGIKKVLICTNHPTTKTSPFNHCKTFSYQESNSKYNRIIRAVATKSKVILVDHEKEWLRRLKDGVKHSELLLRDGLHLSEEGHEVYYKFILPFLT